MLIRKIIIIFFITFFLLNPLYANDEMGSIENTYYPSLPEYVTNSTFIKFIGYSADNILIKLKNAITPGIIHLTNENIEDKNTIYISSISSSSFIGILLSVLLTLECVVLGIKSFLDEGVSFTNLVKHLVFISILIVFIASLPAIGEGLLDIFTTMGLIAGGNKNNENTYFPFMPSTVINMLGECKRVLDYARYNLGSISIKNITKLPELLLIMFASLVIAIPYVIISVLVIFWYLEFSIIILVATIALPFSVFSYSSITDIKSIVKSLLFQGIKIFLGVFLATLQGQIILSSLNGLESGSDNVINLVIYIILMTAIFAFGIIKGPTIFLSALSGSTVTSNMGTGVIAMALGKIKHHKNSNNVRKKTDTILKDAPHKKEKDDDKQQFIPDVAPSHDDRNDKRIYTPSNQITTKKTAYPITSKATASRIDASYEKFKKEGRGDATVKEIQERARWEATYTKLKNMEKNNFIDKNGNTNKVALNQYKQMTEEKKDYLNGTTTWDGEKVHA